MIGAKNQDRLSLLALGYKFCYGIDNLEKNKYVSYCKRALSLWSHLILMRLMIWCFSIIYLILDYYRQVAEKVVNEIYFPRLDESYPNPIKLSNKEAVQSLTRENEDLFYWLKDQARKNILSAQVDF